jgi:hypothetical protein
MDTHNSFFFCFVRLVVKKFSGKKIGTITKEVEKFGQTEKL